MLAVGVLTMLATSAAEPWTRRGELTVESLRLGDVAHVTARLSEAAHQQAEQFNVQIELRGVLDADTVVRVVPDDQRLEAMTLAFRAEIAGDAAAPDSDDGGVGSQGRGQVTYDVELDRCPSSGACDVGFSLEVMEQAGARVALEVSALAERAADGQFVCPDNRDFGSGATVEVTRDD